MEYNECVQKKWSWEGENMCIVTNDISKAVRRKRADLGLTKKEACEQINISFKTLKKIELGSSEIKHSVYKKITNWLIKDY